MRVGGWLAGVVLGVGVFLVPGVAVGQETECLSEVNVAASPGTEGLVDPGEALPVLLVHGFGSSAESMRQLRIAIQGYSVDTSVSLFDYSPWALEWVVHPEIGDRLGEVIRCLADTSLANGGLGRVAVMAHSMGGLAVREALAGDPVMGDRVAVVVTFGTPFAGSDLAQDDAAELGNALLVPLLEVGRSLGVGWVPDPDQLDRMATSSARAGMTPGSSELAALPPWPDSVPVFNNAGQFKLEKRFFFWTSEEDFGDLVVDQTSATGDEHMVDNLGGSFTSDCRAYLPDEIVNGVVELTVQVAALRYIISQDPLFPFCNHFWLTQNQQLVDNALAQLAGASTRRARDEGGDAGRAQMCATDDADATGLVWSYSSDRPVLGIWDTSAESNSSIVLAALGSTRESGVEASELVALDCSTGSEIWQVVKPDLTDVLVVDDLVALVGGDELQVVDVNSGVVRCSAALSSLNGAQSGRRQVVYYRGLDLFLITELAAAFDTSSLTAVDAITSDCEVDWRLSLSGVRTPALTGKDLVFIGFDDASEVAQVLALDPKTGGVVWQTTAAQGHDFACGGCPLLIDNDSNTIVADTRGVAYGINADTGSIVWSLGEGVDQPRWPVSAMLVDDPGTGARLFALMAEPQELIEVSIRDGATLHGVPIPPVDSWGGFEAAIIAGRTVVSYATNDSDRVNELTEQGRRIGTGLAIMDPSDGALLRHLPADGESTLRWDIHIGLGLAFEVGSDGVLSAYSVDRLIGDGSS